MIKSTIARRYAKAILITAKKENRIQEMADELSSLSVLIEQVKRFWELINNPVYSLELRKQVLSEVARRTGMSPPVLGLLMLLLDKHRMKYLPAIISVYGEMADEALGRVRAQVYSAKELTQKEQERIRHKLTRVIGKEIILETIQDTSLIGGIVTKIRGLVLDGSLRTQLARLKESLVKG